MRVRLAAAPVEQWDVFEVALRGPADGNPFADVTFSARFTQGNVSKEVAGFYDGDGTYRVRFMPEQAGQWRYETKSNRAELDGKSGELSVAGPGPKNHGPVRVANTFHFAYADGTPFTQIGTTCYAHCRRLPNPAAARTFCRRHRAGARRCARAAGEAGAVCLP